MGGVIEEATVVQELAADILGEAVGRAGEGNPQVADHRGYKAAHRRTTETA